VKKQCVLKYQAGPLREIEPYTMARRHKNQVKKRSHVRLGPQRWGAVTTRHDMVEPANCK